MKYAIERYAEVRPQIEPLLYEHYLEISKYKDIPLMPDWATYELMDKVGILKIFTCRDEIGNLIGYGIYLLKNHLHYSTCMVAYQDILFIRKENRGSGRKFIQWCDEELKKMGAQMTVQHVKATHNFGPILELMGYELMDHIYTRRL